MHESGLQSNKIIYILPRHHFVELQFGGGEYDPGQDGGWTLRRCSCGVETELSDGALSLCSWLWNGISSGILLRYADNDKLELARDSFSEVLRIVEPGALAEKTALELADICLKLEQSSQSVSVCLQLLDSDVSPQTKQRTLNMLAEAYTQQKDYDKAALALSGQW